MKLSKKGSELSLNTLIFLILGVVVLIVIALIFTGGFSAFTSKLKSFFSQIMSLGG